jgi:hypothetical protein
MRGMRLIWGKGRRKKEEGRRKKWEGEGRRRFRSVLLPSSF